MNKRFIVFFIIASAILMIFAGCANPLMPLDEKDSTPGITGAADKGALTIRVGDGASARTILPTTPTFTKYRLEFSGSEAVDPVEDASTSFDPIYLTPGTWTVTAYGYANFGGSEVVVAQGSGDVTVTAGGAESLTLYIDALQTGGTPGTFDYTLTIPEALNGLVDTYEVKYHPYGDSSSPVSDTAAISYTGSGFSYNNSADIEPGYYLVTVTLSSGDYSATKMEIVHIYSNMVSSGSFAFTEDDIMPLATLSGSLDIKTMGVDQDESGWIIEAYTSSDFAADSIIGDAITDGSSNWSMDVEAQDPAAEVYFLASGTDDSSTPYDGAVVSASAVILGSSDISGIALSENIGQITVSGTLAYTADGTPGADLADWNITPYFDNGNYYATMYAYECTTDASGNWSFTIDESEVDPAEPLGFQIRKNNLSVEFYDGSAIPVEYSDINYDFSLELITLSGTLSHTIDGVSQTDFSDYQMRVSLGSNNQNSSFGYCNVDTSGDWSMLVPSSPESRDLYFWVSNYSINYEKEDLFSFGTISNSAVAGLSLNLGSSVTVSGTLDVLINDENQDLTTWSWSELGFYTSSDYSNDSQIGSVNINASTGGTENWTVTLPEQSPAADIYVAFRGIDSSDEYHSDIDAGSFSLGTAPLTNQTLTAEQGLVTISGSLSGNMNGSALTIAENEWQIFFDTDGPGNHYSSNIETDGSWSCSIPESDTPIEFSYGVSSNAQGYYSYSDEGSISVSNSDISGIPIVLDLVQISGTLNVTIDGAAQDLSTWDYCSLDLYSSSDATWGSSIGRAVVTPGSPSTWLAAVPTQSPSIDLYAFFSGRDGSSNQYSGLEAGMISSVGSSEITGQALTVDSNIITVSGTLQLTVNGSSTALSADDWSIDFFNDIEMINYIDSCDVASDGTWSFEISDYDSATNLYYQISSTIYDYYKLPDAADYITVFDSDIADEVISVDIVEVRGTLSAGTDPTGFAAFEEWNFGTSVNEKNLLFYTIQGAPVEAGIWSIYIDAADSGTETRYLGFVGFYNSGMSAILYQESVSVGQTAVTGVEVEFSALQQWGCSVSGTINAGSTGVDFADGYQMYLLDSPTALGYSGVIGYGMIASDGTFTAQLYEDSAPYDVWFGIITGFGGWISDTPLSLGGGDTTGLAISMDDMSLME